jgi:hypothetical protein
VSSASFAKREREKRQQERAAQKRQRRVDRAVSTQPEKPESSALMERFRIVSEAFASGAITRDAYEAERRTIFSELGLTDAFDD